MPATLTTTTTIAAPVNVVLQARLLARANQKCVYTKGTVPSVIMSHQGSFTAKWRRYDELTPSTSALSEQTGTLTLPFRNSATPSITDITKAVSKYGQHFLLNEEVDIGNVSQQSNELADVLGAAAGRSLNRIMRNEMEDNLTQVRAGAATADNAIVSKITRKALRSVVGTLQKQSAEKFTAGTMGSTNVNTTPVRDAYWGFVHIDVEKDIEDLAGFKSVEGYWGQTETAKGEFGYAGQVRFISTEEASTTANGGGNLGSTGLISTAGSKIDLYESVIIGENAVGSLGLDNAHLQEQYEAEDVPPPIQMIIKPKGSSGVGDPYNEISTAAYKFWLAAKILNGNWGRRLTSGAVDQAA